MKEILLILVNNKKYQFIKIFLVILFSALYYPIYSLFENSLSKNFSKNNISYISTIIYIFLIFILIIFVCFKFIAFSKRNRESLILLGISDIQYFMLFFITNYEILFLQIYLGKMICEIQGMELKISLCINLINAIIIYTLGILVSLKLHSKTSVFLAFILTGMLGILIGTNKLTYHFIYEFIMSEEVKRILFSNSIFSIVIKLVFAICLLLFIFYLYKRTDINISLNAHRLYRMNGIGDFTHKLSKCPVYEKNYFGMYRSKDYLLWKIFSSIFFSFICYTTESNFAIFFTAYAICLITVFYYKDIYNFERNFLLIYFMSNYSYKKLLTDFMISGLHILGDNILLILIIRCVSNPSHFMLIPIIIITILIISLFVNSNLFLKYPAKQYNINICLILITLHLPILNIFYFYGNMKKGKSNWEALTYEHMQ